MLNLLTLLLPITDNYLQGNLASGMSAERVERARFRRWKMDAKSA
jgi:hypothetical protein